MNRLLNAKSLLGDIYTIKVFNVQLAVEGDRGQTVNKDKILITKVGTYGGTTVKYLTKNDLFQDCLNYIKRKGFKLALFDSLKENSDDSCYRVFANLNMQNNSFHSHVYSYNDLFSSLIVMCKIISENRKEVFCNADTYNIGDK